MTEEEYFRKNYPDSCYGDKPLSPYWDFFQDGVEFGERQSEKKIAELEKETKVLEQNLEDTEICENGLKNRIAELEDKLANADYQLEGRDNEIRELKAQLEREKNLNQCMTDNNEQLREMIEKMKCCSMCKYYSMSFLPYYCTKNNTAPHCTSKCDKWEIKEND